MASKGAPHVHVQHHHDKEWMANAVAEGKSTREISRELQISYKLVELKLKEFGIPFNTTDPTKQ